MGFIDFLGNLFQSNGLSDLTSQEISCIEQAKQFYYMKLAQHIVAERYGALLSKCEFKTYIKNEEVKKDNWYLMNVEPNPHQSSSEFMKQLASKLIHEMEALIIITDNGKWYIADSFSTDNSTIDKPVFNNVVIDLYDGIQYQYDKNFSGDNCIYIKYTNKGALELIGQLSSMYSNLIENVITSGSSKVKYLLNIDTTALNGVDVDIDKEITRIVNKDFKALVSDNNTIMPLLNGFKLEALNGDNSNANNSKNANDSVNSMYDQIMINIGQLYNVPKSFMLGTFEEDDMDDFLTFGLDPFADLVEEAINRKYYGKKNYLMGTYCYVDTKVIKHFDILTVSSAINKLISSGVYTINELRKIMDESPVDESIGDVHWITRNYAVVGDYIQEQADFNQAEESGDSKSVTGGGLK